MSPQLHLPWGESVGQEVTDPGTDAATITAISLWEPWASLVATGAKAIETRSWPIRHRGRLLICAARRQCPELHDLLADPDFQRGLAKIAPGRPVIEADLAFGLAVAIVTVTSCVRTERLATDPSCVRFLPFGDFSPGRWGWCFTDIYRLPNPFQVRGRQGIFSVRLPPQCTDAPGSRHPASG